MRKICFIHPFKTGGTSLMMFLSNEYSHQQILRNDYFSTSFEYVDKDELTGLFNEINSNYPLVMGHLYTWASSSLFHQYSNISLLREPVSRVVSRYHHLKSTPEIDYLNAPTQQKELIDTVRHYELVDLLDIDSTLIKFNFHNHQFNMLSSNGVFSVDEIIDAYEVIGCLDKIDAFVEYLSDLYAFSPQVRVPSLNVGHYEKQVSNDLINKIKHYNHLDLSLYEKVSNKW